MKSYYAQWAENEEKRIRNEYQTKRQELLDQALLSGMEEKSVKDADSKELSERYKVLDTEEEQAVKDFMESIPQD
ncbi:MAG: hypothetical protein GX306_13010 [Clostridiales bacterium]|nr:hypothetical protein [Clostridiales bacterium]